MADNNQGQQGQGQGQQDQQRLDHPRHLSLPARSHDGRCALPGDVSPGPPTDTFCTDPRAW